MIELELPYPPSINHYYVPRGRGRRGLNAEAKGFREIACFLIRAQHLEPLAGAIEVNIELFPRQVDGGKTLVQVRPLGAGYTVGQKGWRGMDIDNCQKAVLDAVEHSGLIANDYQILHLDTWRRS